MSFHPLHFFLLLLIPLFSLAKPFSTSPSLHLFPNLPKNTTTLARLAAALNLTLPHHQQQHPTTSPALTYTPRCWSDTPSRSRPLIFPIDDPSDCYEAILLVVEHYDPKTPHIWIERQSWHYGSCSVYLDPVPTRSLVIRDVFPRGDINWAALQVQLECVTEQKSWLGGRIQVGRGVFEVAVMDKLTTAGRERAAKMNG
ncbi:MAG: hypothetical protein LQ350_000497 [Teloschistes chrysophthalmus]|nr:MAG: hypothetical protein LQ350_000497 [Niorma chrysophthalma]